jgi:hypothetical protein
VPPQFTLATVLLLIRKYVIWVVSAKRRAWQLSCPNPLEASVNRYGAAALVRRIRSAVDDPMAAELSQGARERSTTDACQERSFIADKGLAEVIAAALGAAQQRIGLFVIEEPLGRGVPLKLAAEAHGDVGQVAGRR